MFETVVVNIGADAGAVRDAIALARQLVSARRRLWLVHVAAVTARAAPHCDPVPAAAPRRYAAEALARSLATDRGADPSAFDPVPASPCRCGIWDAGWEMDHHLDEVRRQVAALSSNRRAHG